MALANPPLLPHYLFEDPWPAAAALGLIGLILLVHGNRRMDRKVMLIGGLSVVLAGTLFILAAAVTTTREVLAARTREMIALTAPLDATKLRAMFTPGATLSGPDGSVWLDLTQIMDQLEITTRRFHIEDNTVAGLEAEERTGAAGLTELAIRTLLKSEYGSRPVRTRWVFTWSRGDDGRWRVSNMKWTKLEDAPPLFGVWR